jgi:isopentenyl-diphosphate Delta-isomerase
MKGSQMHTALGQTGPDLREPMLVLVNENDDVVGSAAKTRVHREGLLHRAFSVFVTNAAGEHLLQRRAAHKYHSAGLWSNTCCSHPAPGETVLSAAHRRLREEMGFDCPLTPAHSFIYRAELEGDMIEHELDHVLIGSFEDEPLPNPEEVSEWRWASPAAIDRELASQPERFTYWFRVAYADLRSR